MNYNLLRISQENKELENESIVDILECIQKEDSWVFDAGAGAGKTYALIQSIRMIIAEKGKHLDLHHQKIMCITYTNVAADEIKNRLGNTNLVNVSTIHDCVWNIIEPQQKLLLNIHRDKLKNEIVLSCNSLQQEKWAEKYRSLSEQEKNKLYSIMAARKDEYYKHKTDNSSDFKNVFSDVDNLFPGLMSNYKYFQKIIDCLFRIEKYRDAINHIDGKEDKYKKVKYDARFNQDKLERMIISHNTLLEYFQKVVDSNDVMKQLFCDQYPYVLVDEYQDTDPIVVATLNRILLYAKRITHTFVLGYYGDIKQNIYDRGVGTHFREYANGLQIIRKKFNRRSSPRVIELANKIRNDGFEQCSIYEDFPEGEVVFYSLQVERQKILDHFIEKWGIDKKNKLHCFELTNEFVAQQSGFYDIYNFFSTSEWYKRGKNYQLLREHLLAQDEKKLGRVQKLLFRILDFRYRIQQNHTMVLEFFPNNDFKDVNIVNLRRIIYSLQNIHGNTFHEYLESFFKVLTLNDIHITKCIEFVIAEEIRTYEKLQEFLYEQLFHISEGNEISDEKKTEFKQKISDFLDNDILIFEHWYKYVIDKCDDTTVFHTYHSTKGREFDNVIIFMQAKFGTNKTFFYDLMKVINKKNEEQEIGTEIEKARNLLYVAVTRATRNLAIVYSDSIEGAKDNIIEVFGGIENELD